MLMRNNRRVRITWLTKNISKLNFAPESLIYLFLFGDSRVFIGL